MYFRENKNKYMMGTWAYAVAKGLVKEVVISFLMVGHTHEGKYLNLKLVKRKVTHCSSVGQMKKCTGTNNMR